MHLPYVEIRNGTTSKIKPGVCGIRKMKELSFQLCIMEFMKLNIKLEKIRKGHYRADMLNASGSPLCGDGRTASLAMAHLLYLVAFSPTFKNIREEKWNGLDDRIYVNGKMWTSPWETAG